MCFVSDISKPITNGFEIAKNFAPKTDSHWMSLRTSAHMPFTYELGPVNSFFVLIHNMGQLIFCGHLEENGNFWHAAFLVLVLPSIRSTDKIPMQQCYECFYLRVVRGTFVRAVST